MEPYMDTNLSPEERAQALLAQMSLEEKMTQVAGLFAIPGLEDRMAQFLTNGIGQMSFLEMRRIKSLKEAAAWQKRLQEIVMKNQPHHIPAIFHMEGLCGAYIQDATSFPSGIARGSSFDPALEKKIAEIVSRQQKAVGITQILAPVLDISRDSRMGRQGETYGEDPTLAAAMGVAFTKGIQEGETDGRHADATAKHFLAFHHSQGGIHGADAEVPERLLREIYGKSFQAAMTEANLHGVMPCYCTLNGRSVSGAKNILTGLLREEMGFDGVAVSDYGAVSNMHEYQGQFESLEEAGYVAMKAGMDVELPMPKCFGKELQDWFAEGKADITVLDQAVLRELTAKFRMGLFEHPFALQDEALMEAFYADTDEEITLQSARESMVLLKNDGTLPLSKNLKKIAVIGPHAANARFFFGGYTHLSMMEAQCAAHNSMAGVYGESEKAEYMRVPGTEIQSDEAEVFDAVLKLQKPNCKNLLEVLGKELPWTEIVWDYGYPIAGEDESHYENALAVMKDADVILFTLGGKYSSGSISTTGEGVDASTINLPPCQDKLIALAAKLGKPMVGVHFDGRPVSSDVADKYLNALVEAWSPAECGAQAVVETLVGKNNPSGKMPVSIAYHAGQIPVYYNHPMGSLWHQGESIGFQTYVDLPHKARYAFGHGLSYTTFAYENLVIDHEAVKPDDTVKISFEVANTGDVAGTEVVQLYLRDRYASMVRPQMELAGFARVALEPGEKKKVQFVIEPSQLAFLDEDMRWKIEKGDIDVFVGSASDDIRLEGSFKITEDAWICGRERKFWAESEKIASLDKDN
ncbi:MAG: glycoside hydrolase family 3 C-terminal domain-containing protein [Lachnospiraceae bacterium]|nr:glycoside hydrolase family 3 C-terminal domain-containing protein [Lachnospiraceae bacterium]